MHRARLRFTPMTLWLLSAVLVFSGEFAMGQDSKVDPNNHVGRGEVTLSEIGAHYPIFFVEKNENPQNVLVAYTKLDANCNVVKVNGQPLLDYYWLMDRVKYKPVHPLIKSGIRDRLKLAGTVSSDPRTFSIQMTDLNELQQDLGVATLEVLASKQDGGCHVAASIKLGPSDGGKIVNLESLYTESSKTFLPPFRKVKSVTLSGTGIADARPIKRQYLAK
ncbi:hypothetical protein BH10BDE1_BH10BDE1_12780 [soil metagenome]